jgi:inorganic phosphate transporter, PiT family
MGSSLTILVLVVAFALAFDYINGFHDTANAVATVVSTNVLPGRTAVLLAAACNFIGAFMGVGVAQTIGRDIADPASITQLVIAAALLGAIAWNLLTWYLGIPSSSSHALVGGLIGAVWCYRVLNDYPAGESIEALLSSTGVVLTLKALVISPLVDGSAPRAVAGQPRVPHAATRFGRFYGFRARFQRRPEVDGNHHAGPRLLLDRTGIGRP